VGQLLVGAKRLKEEFPSVLSGKPFASQCQSLANDSDHFSVLVISIDGFSETLDEQGNEASARVVVRLAKVLDGMAKTRDMAWGRLEQERFACLCRDMDEAKALALATELQRRFLLVGDHTLSVGLAVYPFWPFEKTSVLSNAEKALEHASFFGPNTITPFDAVSLNISADKLYQYGDIHGAIDEFKKALMVDAENVNVHNSLGVCYGVLEEFDSAIDAFETVVALNPRDVMATYNLGLAYLKTEDRKKALELLLAAYDLDGDHPDIATHIGLCYEEMGQTDKALQYLEPAAQNAPKSGPLFRVLGDCYVSKGFLVKATKAFERAIRANPKDAKSLNTLAHLYGTLGKNVEIAIVLAKESTIVDPENGHFKMRLGELYLQNKEFKKALEEFEKANALGQDCSGLIENTKDMLDETQAGNAA
jgi:tetratricopeptide (TPR) repeat protein